MGALCSSGVKTADKDLSCPEETQQLTQQKPLENVVSVNPQNTGNRSSAGSISSSSSSSLSTDETADNDEDHTTSFQEGGHHKQCTMKRTISDIHHKEFIKLIMKKVNNKAEYTKITSERIRIQLMNEGYNRKESVMSEDLRWDPSHYTSEIRICDERNQLLTIPDASKSKHIDPRHRRRSRRLSVSTSVRHISSLKSGSTQQCRCWLMSVDPIRDYILRITDRQLSPAQVDHVLLRWKGQEEKLLRRFDELWESYRALLNQALIEKKDETCFFKVDSADSKGVGLEPFSKRYKVVHVSTHSSSHILGKGAFGAVYKLKERKQASHHHSDHHHHSTAPSSECRFFAGKKSNRLALESMNDASMQCAIREINILRRVQHPNIVEYIGAYDCPLSICIVMELLNGGNLYDFLVAAPDFTLIEAAHYFRQLIKSLCYLHSSEVAIVHRDIKPANILFSRRLCKSETFESIPKQDWPVLKLADFGTATELCEFKRQFAELKLQSDVNVDSIGDIVSADRSVELIEQVGTPEFMAPELVRAQRYGAAADVWSAGCILYTLICGRKAFEYSHSMQQLANDILFPQFDARLFADRKLWDLPELNSAQKLIKRMLRTDQRTRYTSRKVLNHCWFKEMSENDDCDEISSKVMSSEETGMDGIGKKKRQHEDKDVESAITLDGSDHKGTASAEGTAALTVSLRERIAEHSQRGGLFRRQVKMAQIRTKLSRGVRVVLALVILVEGLEQQRQERVKDMPKGCENKTGMMAANDKQLTTRLEDVPERPQRQDLCYYDSDTLETSESWEGE